MTTRQKAGVALAVLILAALAASFVVPFLGWVPKEELVKTSAWAIAALFAFAGWGSLLARVCWPSEEVPLSLRAAWGASAFAFAGGALAAGSQLSRAFLYFVMAAGLVAFGREIWVARDSLLRRLRVRLRASRLHAPLTLVVLFVCAVVAIHWLGGASDTSSNPYDDDISYYPFAKQLLERGTLLDPFSFRRMSTLGGQALFQALLLTRVPILHLNVFDQAMCLVLAVGLLSSHRIGGKKIPALARIISVVFLVALPSTSINSASYYSGLAFFLALFITLERMPDALATDPRTAVLRTVPLALVGAAICTLRQNYQVPVAMVVLVSYGFAVARTRRGRSARELLVEPLAAMLLTALFVLPWLVLLYRSNLTFLFPLMKGTFRPGVDTRSHLMTAGKFVRFMADVWLSPDPIQALPLFALVGLYVREASPRRVLASQWIAGLIGLAALCWGFTLSDSGNLARYDYGFFTASALLTWHAVSLHVPLRGDGPARALIPGAVLVFALFYTLETNTIRTKKMIDARLRDVSEMLRRSVPMQHEPPVAGAYHRLQEATPAGARLLVLVDQPFFFDFARNEIWNLDMPGTASLPPGIPCFRGPEPVADYLLSKGIRYVAFVESEHSTFLYRHEIWFDHIYDRDEIWRVYAPYMTDVMDNLARLAKSRRHLRDEAGMVLLDLTQSQAKP